MAKVIGLLKLHGTIDDTTFRKTEDGIIAGMKPGPSREKVLTHANFRNTRRNAGEFKLAVEEATLLRHALGEALNGRKGSSLNGRMFGLFCKAARQDVVSDWGSRRASMGATSMLKGFDFNKQLSLEHALPVPLTHRLDVTTGACAVQVPSFIARKRKGFPAEAKHFRILSGMVMVDFVHGHYRRAMQCSELFPLSKKTPEEIGFEHRLEPGEGKVMVQVLGMEFYKLVDGKEVLVKGSSVRVLEAVRIEDEAMGTSTQPHEARLHCTSRDKEEKVVFKAAESPAGDSAEKVKGLVREDTNQGERGGETWEEGKEALRQQGNEEKGGKQPSCTEVSVSEKGDEVEREADKLTGTSTRVHKAGLPACVSDRENICFDSSTCPAPAGSLTLQELPNGQDCKTGFGITSKKEVYACESG